MKGILKSSIAVAIILGSISFALNFSVTFLNIHIYMKILIHTFVITMLMIGG